VSQVQRAPRAFRHKSLWLPLAAMLALVAMVAVWLSGVWTADRFSEYPMQVKTDIPTAIDVAPNGAVWFIIEFSDAVGIFQNGKIRRIRRKDQNLEVLGLAADDTGGAWVTDAAARAISHILADGEIRSFPLSTPIVRLGRLALAPDGAVWFADMLMASVTRLQNGVFTMHSVGQQGGTPYGIALDRSGNIWATLQGSDKLARIANNGELTTFDVPTRNSGLGDLAVDESGAVWFLELRANKIGRLAGERFAEFEVPTPSAGLASLAPAPDGSLWFTELHAGKLGRIKDGNVSEFGLPRASSRPFGVAVDTSNVVWYTDLGGWLGRFAYSR
jgi:virginiamycin B lyase